MKNIFNLITDVTKNLKAKKRIMQMKLPLEKNYKICSVLDWVNAKKLPILPAGEPEKIPFSYPPTLGKDGYQAPSTPEISTSNEPYVAELKNVMIFSNSSIIIADNFALSDTGAHPQYGNFVNLSYDKAVVNRNKNNLTMKHFDYTISVVKEGIYLSGRAANEYGHWVQEFLPKLQYFEHHPNFRKLPLIVDGPMPQSHYEYLSHIVSNPVIKIPENSGFYCHKLLVAPTTTFLPTNVFDDHQIPQHLFAPLSPKSLCFLRERVTKNIKSSKQTGTKLYLSRKNMRWRLLQNEPEVAEFLASAGFQIVYIEKYSFEEQVKLFQQADCIVAPNGSALHNVIYSKPELKLFVLSQPGLHNWGGYYGPMHALGYNMLFITGDEVDNQKHANYAVPIERIRAALNDF